MKILLAVDGSDYTKKMLAYLATHEDLFSPAHSYTLFTAQPALPPRAANTLGKVVVDKYYTDESEKVLKPALKFLAQKGIAAKSAWKAGHVAELISKFATSGKFDLLVMGSHGHNALGNLVLGSIVTKVLAGCEVPVLIVR